MIIFYVVGLLFLLLTILCLIVISLKVYIQLTNGRCTCNVCLIGKTVLITGGNAGIGYETALALASRGCRVIIAQRSNSDKIKEEIIAKTGNANIITKQFNLDSLNSVRRLAKDINETEERLDILINNAGALGLGGFHTEDGLHIGMQVNHFGSFLLTHLLIGLLKKSSPSRIIFVSSTGAHLSTLTTNNLNPRDGPDTTLSRLANYANAKLCNLIAAKEFATKLDKTGVTVNAVHPGVVNTEIFPKFHRQHTLIPIVKNVYQFLLDLFAKDPEEGAQTIIHVALSKKLNGVTGKFFSDYEVASEPSKVKNSSFRKEIWDLSEKYVKLQDEEKL